MGNSFFFIEAASSGADWSFTLSDLLNILGIAANVILAIIIINYLQKKIDNKRVMKDHFIQEVKELKLEYITLINNVYSGKYVSAVETLPELKLLSIKINNLNDYLTEIYSIKDEPFMPYQIELNKIITENYIELPGITKIGKEAQVRRELLVFEQKYIGKFTDVIILINNHSK